jgi:predicted RNase H-like HicB family nuclease/DNA-binding XRE family transcriptional regulator
MKFIGKILPKKTGEKYHSVAISDLGIYTQGKDLDDCLAMAKDALESLFGEAIEVSVEAYGKGKITVTARDLKPLIGRFLEVLREKRELSIREVTNRLGKSSPNYYAQYEKGRVLPSLTVMTEIVKAMSPDEDIVVSLHRTA